MIKNNKNFLAILIGIILLESCVLLWQFGQNHELKQQLELSNHRLVDVQNTLHVYEDDLGRLYSEIVNKN